MMRIRHAVLLLSLVCACGSGGFASHPDRGPVKLAFTAQPLAAFAGAAISPLAVTVQDAYGNTVSNAGMSITVAIGTNPGGGELSGTTTMSAAGGVALFPDLVIDKPGAGYTLTAEASGLTGAASGPVDVVPPPRRLAFTISPWSPSLAGRGLGEVKVSILDEMGNTVTSSAMDVRVAIAAGPAGATLSGTATVAAVNGVATFPSLSIDIPGSYTLAASACSLTGATTAPFAVIDPASVSVGCWNLGPPADLGLQTIGTSSPPRTVTLINTCTSAQELLTALINGFSWTDFSLTSHCPASIDAGASCTFDVTFSPTGPGHRAAGIILNTDLPSEAWLPLEGTAIGGLSLSIASDPTGTFGQFAYVANASTGSVSMYRIDHATGALTFLAPPSIAAGTSPASVAVDPSGRFAYVANAGSNDVSSYRIGADGTLAPLGSAVAAGTFPVSVAVARDSTGKSGGFAYVANAGSSNVSMYTIDHDTGALTSVGTMEAGVDNPVSVAGHPSGKFVYVASDGVVYANTHYLNSGVAIYAVDTTTGALTPAGAGITGWNVPTSLGLDPSGTFVALSNDVGSNANVNLWTVNPTTGAMVPVQTFFVPSPTSVAIIAGPSGELFAFATTNALNAVLTYGIDTGTWASSLTGTTAAAMSPTSIAIDPSGRFAYVANSGSGSVSMYSINADGTLTPLVPGTIGT